MEMKTSEEKEGDCSGFNIDHVVVISKMARFVVIGNAWYEYEAGE